MARGLPRRVVLGSGGAAESVYGQYDIDIMKKIYTVSATKDDAFDIGDVVVTADGREYVYSYSAGACISGQACEFTDTGVVAITTLSTAQSGGGAIGTTTIEIPAATHSALTLDQLRGGYIVIFNGTDNNIDFRQIIGNDVSAENAALVVYVDAGVSQAITTSSKVEVFANPYRALQGGSSETLAKAGVAAAPVSAASKYFWCKTKGMHWVAPQSGVGANGGIGCFWRHDGSLESADTAFATTIATYDTSQYAGNTVAGTAAGNGPLFLLK
jgi:hypothetical protein